MKTNEKPKKETDWRFWKMVVGIATYVSVLCTIVWALGTDRPSMYKVFLANSAIASIILIVVWSYRQKGGVSKSDNDNVEPKKHERCERCGHIPASYQVIAVLMAVMVSGMQCYGHAAYPANYTKPAVVASATSTNTTVQDYTAPMYLYSVTPDTVPSPETITPKFWVYACALVALGVGTWYGFKYICKKAGLTNSPPPPPPSAPPPPINTNSPPPSRSSALVGVSAQILTLTSLDSPLFRDRDDGTNPATLSAAIFSATDLNGLYGATGYLDPSGQPYDVCIRKTLQSSTNVNVWTNAIDEVTTYIWVNDTYTYSETYQGNGSSRVLLEKGFMTPISGNPGVGQIPAHSWDSYLLPNVNTPQKYFRTSKFPMGW